MANLFPEHYRFVNTQEAVRYILSPRAVFTLISKETNRYFTYRVYQFKREPHILHLKGRSKKGYEDIATIEGGRVIPLTRGKRHRHDYKAFLWAYRNLFNGRFPDKLEIYHHGTCGNCGRRLTHPNSIERGIGPECYKKYSFMGV